MAEVLRPMSTSELLDRTFSLYRRHFKLFVGIATLGPAANLVFQLIMVASAGIPATRSAHTKIMTGAYTVLGLLVGYAVMMTGMAISQAATVKAVAAVHLGRDITIGAAYCSLKGRVRRILAVFFLVLLLVFGCSGLLVFVAVLIAGFAIGGGAAAGTGFAILGGIVGLIAVVAAILAAVTIFVRYALAIQACVVEDLRLRASLKRSALLSKGSRGRILAVYSVFFVLSLVLGAIVGVLGFMMPALLGAGVLSLVIVYLAAFVSGSLTGPLATIGMSLVYYDERVRKEAFDLQLMIAGLDPPAPVPAPVALATP